MVLRLAVGLLLPTALVIGSGLSESEIEKAIALGKHYKNPARLWKQEFERTNKLKMSGYWSMSGSKYLSVITDRVVIAVASASAAHEMRAFTADDAKRLPGLGKIRVIVAISAVGASNIARIQERFASGKTHMILEVDGQQLQPEQKIELGSDYAAGLQVWNFIQVGNAVLASNAGAFDRGTVTYAFTYSIPDEQHATKLRFVLVGDDDKQHTVEVAVSNLQ